MFCLFKHFKFYLNRLNYIFLFFYENEGQRIEHTVSGMFARLKLSAISGLYCLYYLLKDKTRESSATMGHN